MCFPRAAVYSPTDSRAQQSRDGMSSARVFREIPGRVLQRLEVEYGPWMKLRSMEVSLFFMRGSARQDGIRPSYAAKRGMRFHPKMENGPCGAPTRILPEPAAKTSLFVMRMMQEPVAAGWPWWQAALAEPPACSRDIRQYRYRKTLIPQSRECIYRNRHTSAPRHAL